MSKINTFLPLFSLLRSDSALWSAPLIGYGLLCYTFFLLLFIVADTSAWYTFSGFFLVSQWLNLFRISLVSFSCVFSMISFHVGVVYTLLYIFLFSINLHFISFFLLSLSTLRSKTHVEIHEWVHYTFLFVLFFFLVSTLFLFNIFLSVFLFREKKKKTFILK